MRRFAILLTVAAASTLATPAASAQQQPPVAQPSAQAPRAVAPQVVWTPTYFCDSTGALWLIYVPNEAAGTPTTPTQAPAPTASPDQPNGMGPQGPPSLVTPSNREQGAGRNVRMHEPWMKGRR